MDNNYDSQKDEIIGMLLWAKRNPANIDEIIKATWLKLNLLQFKIQLDTKRECYEAIINSQKEKHT